MLLTTMTPAEINTQIYREYDKLYSTTVIRLLYEYDRERKKLKIDKTRLYTKDYHVKTKDKNKWIIFIGKAPAIDKYNGPQTTAVNCSVYYHTEKGIRVFNPCPNDIVEVYNSHFFARYNERLGLNLTNTVDIITHFFKYNRDHKVVTDEKGDRMLTTGFCKHGLLLGEYDISYNYDWLVWKTFVSRNLTRKDQKKTENEILQEIITAYQTELQKQECDKQLLWNYQNKIREITGAVAE